LLVAVALAELRALRREVEVLMVAAAEQDTQQLLVVLTKLGILALVEL
jgi:hypothetical protein